MVELKPIALAMFVYLALAVGLPELLKKPTGIALIDDINMLLIAQKGSLMSGAILTGLIAYLTAYAVEQEFV